MSPTTRQQLLDELASTLKARFGAAIDHHHLSPDALEIDFPLFEDAWVYVAVDDTTRPSFWVSYPCLMAHHATLSEAVEVMVPGMLTAGVLWIVRAVARHGVVLPEFPHPHLERHLLQ
jgi:hypothetical protein